MNNQKKKILILDSSQISAFLNCQTKWYYEYLKRLIPREAGENVPMEMGTYGHKLLEIYYKALASGRSKSAAFSEACDHKVELSTCRCSHEASQHVPSGSGGICTSTGCPCLNYTQAPYPLQATAMAEVRNRTMEYTFAEGIQIPDLRAKTPEHVEVGFSHKLFEDENYLFILEGRVDIMGRISNNVEEGWADHKFQMRKRSLYKKSVQFRNYSMVLKLGLGVINYIRFAKKIEKDTFERIIISFSRQEMEWWRGRLIDIFKQVQETLDNPLWYSPNDERRNRSACPGQFGYPCDYVKLCEEAQQPQLVQIYESSDFKQKNPWRPW